MMNRDQGLEGEAFRLRPVRREDAAFIFSLRNNAALTEFLQDGPQTLADQQAWQEAQEKRENDCYYIIERISSNRPEGTIALYNYNKTQESAEWGRWIVIPGSLAAVESVFLIYKLGLEIFALDYVYSQTNASNAKTVSFHDHSGIPRKKLVQHTLVFKGASQEIQGIEHGCHRAEWNECSQLLRGMTEQIAELAARKEGEV